MGHFSRNEEEVFPFGSLGCRSRFLVRSNHVIARGEHLDEDQQRLLGGAVLVGGPPSDIH